ncbi:MAG TPA: hypothetical protein VNZ62_15340, partial [Capillimicrobium sp.]|nr:hypothetical protein [Capillimicrobium sp.]
MFPIRSRPARPLIAAALAAALAALALPGAVSAHPGHDDRRAAQRPSTELTTPDLRRAHEAT